ncbi:MAG: insulinase family protein [Bacilli bacterium]|nr:insulinase family protein [Bacilli bacterium]
MEYKIHDCKSYRIHTIKTDKFKNCSMEIMFRNKLEKSEITQNNMLVDMLVHSSNKYPKRRDVSIELENLYSASFRGFTTRLGSSVMLSFCLDFLNPKYCEKGYLDDVLSLPFEMLLNPNIKNNEFDNRSFNIIKNRIKSDIESLKENATKYAFRRSLINMDENSPSSYYMVGYMDDLEAITPSNLVDAYNNLLNNYTCDIFVIGNLDMDEVVTTIKNKFNNRTIKTDKIELYVDNSLRKKYIDVEETGKYEQDSFIMIYNLDDLSERERNFVIHIYNIILGSGGLTSKLYRYLREENSLCYNVSSMIQKYDGLLMIYSGIDGKDKDLCIDLVNKAMKEMSSGDFSDLELENAIKTVISSLKMGEDTQGGIVNNYLFNYLDNLPLYEERVKEFKTVTKEEVINVAKRIKLNTIYLLKGEDK